jgi:hypothetical protein
LAEPSERIALLDQNYENDAQSMSTEDLYELAVFYKEVGRDGYHINSFHDKVNSGKSIAIFEMLANQRNHPASQFEIGLSFFSKMEISIEKWLLVIFNELPLVEIKAH